jgi:hypothetical protein
MEGELMVISSSSLNVFFFFPFTFHPAGCRTSILTSPILCPIGSFSCQFTVVLVGVGAFSPLGDSISISSNLHLYSQFLLFLPPFHVANVCGQMPLFCRFGWLLIVLAAPPFPAHSSSPPRKFIVFFQPRWIPTKKGQFRILRSLYLPI